MSGDEGQVGAGWWCGAVAGVGPQARCGGVGEVEEAAAAGRAQGKPYGTG
ncbi:hypothetical protein CEDDRAFT_02584, partial [Frankia sp. CeD]